MSINPLALVEDVANARTSDELHTAIQRATHRLGFETYCFGMVYREPGTDQFRHFSIDNYRTGWIEHYTKYKYLDIDIAVTHCMSHATPLVWTSKLYDAPHLRPIQEEALSYGIDAGITLPIHSPWLSGVGALIIANGEQADRVAAHASEFIANSQLLACHISQAVRDLNLLPGALNFRPTEALSIREIECLRWAAFGLPAQAIADRMNISVTTVNSHFLPSIRRKLGVASTLEAVSLAFRHRLIPM